MPTYRFLTVDVFTATRFGGNPLAVFPDAAGLSGAHMQALAAEFNLSETTFVLPPEDPAHTARVRIFGPRMELPFAGHPNVGTGFVLARAMRAPPDLLVFEELAGLVSVAPLRGAGGAVTGARIAAPLPLELGAEVPPATIAACVGLAPADIVVTRHAPVIASVGIGFVIAEVAGRDALGRAMPDPGALRAVAPDFPAAAGFKLLLHAPAGAAEGTEETTRRLRMFAPLTGVVEDPATGSAAAALAALLMHATPGGSDARDFAFAQGIEMGRPSRILARAERSAGGAIRASVAGECGEMLRGEISL